MDSLTYVVIPTYNEVGNIERLVPEIARVLPDARILVVDDNSPDGTADIVERCGRDATLSSYERVTVIRRPGKNGLGSAYREGFRYAIDSGASVCIQMDADFSHDPACLPLLVRAIKDGADLVVGSRYVPGGDISNWAWSRRQLSRWANRYAAWMLGLPMGDATGGYRAYTSDMLNKMDFSTIDADGYGFQIAMSHRANLAHATITEVPITFVDREVGQSKLSRSIIVEAFVLVLALAWKRRRINR